MMNGDGPGDARTIDPVERAKDLFVHLPIGFAVMAWKRLPEFVGTVPDLVGQALSKGCAQLVEAEGKLSEEVRKARMIGQVAVMFGGRQLRREVDARLAEARRTAEGVAGFIAGTAPDSRSTNGAERPAAAPAAAPAPTATAEPAPAAKAAKGARRPSGPATRVTGARASAAALPIREYDELSASQVVSRLTGLTPAELQAVRAYEEGSRGRRTVLQAIDRLLG
jgi:hypothetical protein